MSSGGLSGAFADVQAFNKAAGREVGDLNDPKVPAATPGASGELLRAHSHLMGADRILQREADDDGDELLPSDMLLFLRARLLTEEVAEIVLAMGGTPGATRDALVADGLADLIYVALDAAVAFGIDMGPVWRAVQAANMAKTIDCPACDGVGTINWVGISGPDAEPPTSCQDCRGTGRTMLRDVQGKIVKPEKWAPPDIAAVLEHQRAERAEHKR